MEKKYVPFARRQRTNKKYEPVPRRLRSDKQWEPALQCEDWVPRFMSVRADQPTATGYVPARQAGPGGFAPEDQPGVAIVLKKTPNKHNSPGTAEYDYYRVVMGTADIGYIVVYYYIPDYHARPWTVGAASGGTVAATEQGFAPGAPTSAWVHQTPGIGQTTYGKRRQVMFGIHGAGAQHYSGARNRMFQFRDFADANNLILIAPTFSRWYQPWQGRYPIGYMPPTWVVAGSQEDRAMLDEYYQRKWGIPYPWDFSENLYWFVDLVTPYSQYRTDLALNYIFDLFREQFPDLSDRFMLYGHSGGGQFTARYMLTHPERLSKVALSSAGSLLFPLFDRNFPVGMNCAHIIEEGYGTAGRPPGYAADLMALREEDWLLKIAKLHRIPTIVTVGSKENGPNDDTDAMRNWQGKNTLEKTRNFALAMNSASAAARLRLIGGGGARRGSTLGSSGFASLSPATGIGRLWPDDAYYEPLYLEFDETHADNLSCTVDWLSRFWADYPHKVPYYTNDLGWHYV